MYILLLTVRQQRLIVEDKIPLDQKKLSLSGFIQSNHQVQSMWASKQTNKPNL